jgi:hypothetical protein
VSYVVLTVFNACLVRALGVSGFQIIAISIVEDQQSYISFRAQVDWVVDRKE